MRRYENNKSKTTFVKRGTKNLSYNISSFNTIIYSSIPKNDNDIYVISQAGDRLDLLANQFYGDVDLWWIIAISNIGKVRRDSFFIKPGLQIRIPQNTQEIIEKYNTLNQ